MTPENEQNYVLSFEKRMGEGIRFFPYRDFFLLYSWTKLYAPDIWTDLCRSRIIVALQILYKSLFLFYGKRFLFYDGFPSASGKRVFRAKEYPEDNDNYFKMREWIFPISGKKIRVWGEKNPIVGNLPQVRGSMNPTVGNHSQTRRRVNPIVGNHSQTQRRMNPIVGNLPQVRGSMNPTVGDHSQTRRRMNPIVGNHSRNERYPSEMKEKNFLKRKSLPASIAGLFFSPFLLLFFNLIKTM